MKTSRAVIFSTLTLSILTLVGCGEPYSKEVGPNPDPGRVVKVENSELVKIQLGNTTVFYIGDKATQTCLALSERLGLWWGRGNSSVSITQMPPYACGFPAKTEKTEVVNLHPPSPKALPASTSAPKKAVSPPTSCSVCKTQ